MKKTMMAVALAALGLASVAPAAPVVNARQFNQTRRIDAGVRSGKLTHSEAAQLKSEQRAIAMQEKGMKARHRGHLTRRDKQIIHRRQEAANRHILQQKHDAQRGRNKLKVKL